MLNRNKTIYSKIVYFKKRFIKTQIIPDGPALIIDSFFNNLHNSFFQSLELARDAAKKSKDITRDAIVHSKDIFRDSLVRSKDISKDALFHSRDVARDSLIISKDLAKDAVVRSKDVTRDFIVISKDLTKEAISKTGNANLWFYIKLPFIFLKNFFWAISLELSLRKYSINEKSDQEAIKHIQKIITNSENIKKRVKLYYNRDSETINPPIETKKLFYKDHKNYWLSVNRLTPEKRIEMQIAAFNRLPSESLIIVGGYDNGHTEYARYLQKMNQANVFFTESVTEPELLNLYSECRGFITTSIDEDFGMTVVEAMASGKPVIAPNEGGYKETMIDGKTGILINDINENKVVEAIKIIGQNSEQYKNFCTEQAKRFSTEIFIERIKKEIESF